MSLISLMNNNVHGTVLHTLGWVLGSINWNKVKHRVRAAREHPENDVKCVLLEYDYTSLADVRQHNLENKMDLVPGSGMIANKAINDPALIKILRDLIGGNVVIFTRKKHGNIQRRQLVLVIKQWTFDLPMPSLTRHNASLDFAIGRKRSRASSEDSTELNEYFICRH